MTLESILNVVIPWGVVIVFAGLFYAQPKIKHGINAIGRWIGGIFSKIWEELSGVGTDKVEYQTIYKYE